MKVSLQTYNLKKGYQSSSGCLSACRFHFLTLVSPLPYPRQDLHALTLLTILLICSSGEFHLGFQRSELQGASWYQLLHWDCMREAQSKHRLSEYNLGTSHTGYLTIIATPILVLKFYILVLIS